MKFYITKHCKDRYIERVLANVSACDNVTIQILKDLSSGTNITSKLSEQLPRFILYLKERYGSDRGYNIIKKDYTFFILTKRKGTKNLYDVVTCYVEFELFKKFTNTVLTNDKIHLRLAMLK